MNRIDGKVAIVTGAASGIGEATARLMAEAGGLIVLTDLAEERGSAIARAIREAGGEAVFLRHDVSCEEDWTTMVEETLARYGRLDILVNNAGVGQGGGNIEEATLESWRALMAVNLEGVFLGTQAAVKAMKETGGGSIVNVSSVYGIVASAMTPAYNASKAGVRLFTKSVAIHCGEQRYGIRVNSVHPGFIETPLIQNALQNNETRAFLTARHPIGRLGLPRDIANGILFLASDDSSFITGSELVIDGGYTAQ